MESSTVNPKITLEDCRLHIENKIFSFSPKDYKAKYPKWPGSVGLEVEMLPLRLNKNETVPGKPELVDLQGSRQSLSAMIQKLADEHNWPYKEEIDGDSNKLLLLVNMDHEDNLSFEPGGQLEFSSKPYPCLQDAIKRMHFVQNLLNDKLAQSDISLIQLGCNPWYETTETKLQMPKNRYRAMDTYFTQIGPWGRRMMRLTCTIQVCLDFGEDEKTMAKRFLGSQLIAPFAGAIFAYSPFTDAKPSPFLGYRTKIWQHLDKSRTGYPPNLQSIYENLNKESCVESYLEFLLNSNVVFVESLNYMVPSTPITFGEWLENPIDGVSPTQQDLETHLSLLFPEVRPRNFLELRSVDSQSVVWQSVPASFYTGLLYDDKNLDTIIEMLHPYIDQLPTLQGKAVNGLQDDFIFETSIKIMEMAISGFSSLPSCFLGEEIKETLDIYYKHFTKNRKTPADDLLELYYNSDPNEVSVSLYRSLEDSWRSLLLK